ncbi:hypothetical protein SQ03_24320, partial [Methylobacterium platani JCM 14648]
MTEHAASGSYKEVILFLVTAGIVVPLFHRLRISPVLGFIGAGALLGPSGLGRLAETVPWLGVGAISGRTGIAHPAGVGVGVLMVMVGGGLLSLITILRCRRIVRGW